MDRQFIPFVASEVSGKFLLMSTQPVSDSTQNAPSTESSFRKEEFLEVCRSVDRCFKRLNLYPSEHPRVQESLEELRTSLIAYEEQASCKFCYYLNITDQYYGESVPKELMLLKKFCLFHFIQEVKISVDLTLSELESFCHLIDFENNESTEDDESDIFKEWKNIEIKFFIPEDIENWGNHSGSILHKITGIGGSDRFKSLLSEMPGHVREVISNTVFSKSILERISFLRTQFNSKENLDNEKLDLVSEVLFSVISESSNLDEKSLSEEKVESSLNRLLHVLEENVNSLNEDVLSYISENESGMISDQIRDVVLSGFEVSNELSDLNEMRNELSAIFRIADSESDEQNFSVVDRYLFEEEALEVLSKNGRKRDTFSDEGDFDLQKAIDRIKVPDRISEEDFTNDNRLDKILNIFLNIYPKSAGSEREDYIWENLLNLFEEPKSNLKYHEETLKRLITTYQSSSDPRFQKLFHHVLDAVSGQVKEMEVIQSLVVERPEILDSYFTEKVKEDSQACLELVLNLKRSNDFHLKDFAVKMLLKYFCEIHSLWQWATRDLEYFSSKVNLAQVIKETEAEKMTTGFLKLFENISVESICKILRRLPNNKNGAEKLTIKALNSESPFIRNVALECLGKYSSSVSFKTLKSLIEHQNLQNSIDEKEVRSVLKALVQSEYPEAQKFVSEIANKRKFLVKSIYNKEIRKILSEVQKGESMNDGGKLGRVN